MKTLRYYSFILLAFLWLPLLSVAWKGLSLDAFQKLLKNEELMASFLDSFLVAGGSAVLAVSLALCTAFALPHLNSRLQKFVIASLFLPLVLPEIAFGISYLVWFKQIGFPLGWSTLIFSHMAFSFCFVALTLKPAVFAIDHQIPQAAQDLGANGWQVFRHGILPQISPAILAGFFMAFSLSLDDFLLSFFVKGVDQMTLPVKIFSMMRLKIGEEIYALSLLLFLFSSASVIISRLCLKKS